MPCAQNALEHATIGKADDGTVDTETSEDIAVLTQKATVIQAHARGLIDRNRLNNREKYAMFQTRARAGHTFMEDGNANFNLEYNIRAVRELLKTNKETWSRCFASCTGDISDTEKKFMRIGFVSVETRTVNNTVTFSSKAELSEKSFDIGTLKVLPGKLGGIFEVKHDEHGFVDYEAFLEKALLLHEDVLRPFLVKLRDHMISVLQSLTAIESWLKEPSSDLTFIRNTFDLDESLTIPEEEEIGKTRVLKECKISDDIQVAGTFNVKQGRDQTMMRKLLTFILS